MSFAEQNYEVLRSVVSKDLLDHLCIEFDMVRKNRFLMDGISEENRIAYGDPQVPNSFSHYGAYCFEALSFQLLPIIEKVTQKQLHPTFSYARIYYKDAVMTRHIDRPGCEYSITFCVAYSEPWDIWFKQKDGTEVPVTLNPGDMIIYKGGELEHWRDTYNGEVLMQAFLMYVDANGEYRNQKFDGRPNLGMSYNNARKNWGLSNIQLSKWGKK